MRAGGLGEGPEIDQAIENLRYELEQLSPTAKKAAKDFSELQSILSETPSAKFDEMVRRLRLLDDALALPEGAKGKITIEQWSEGVRVVTSVLDDGKKAAEDTTDIGRELGLTFSSAFEDAVIAGMGLRDVLRGIEKNLLRIGTRKLITEPLADWLSGLVKSAGGTSGLISSDGNWIGSLFSGASSGFAGVFAEGGFIKPGQWGVVGERGPEIAFGGPSGTTIQPGGGMIVNNTFVISGAADRRTQSQIASAAARSVTRAAARYS